MLDLHTTQKCPLFRSLFDKLLETFIIIKYNNAAPVGAGEGIWEFSESAEWDKTQELLSAAVFCCRIEEILAAPGFHHLLKNKN